MPILNLPLTKITNQNMTPHHSLSPSHNQNPNPNLLLPHHHPSAVGILLGCHDYVRPPLLTLERNRPVAPSPENVVTAAAPVRFVTASPSPCISQPPPRHDRTRRSRCHHHAGTHGCTFFAHELPDSMVVVPSSSSLITLLETATVAPSHLVKLFATHTAYACSNNSRRQPRCHRVRHALWSTCHLVVRICNNLTTVNL